MSTKVHIMTGYVNQCVNRSVVQKQQEALTFALVPVELIKKGTEMNIYDIEFRFVERQATKPIREGVAEIYIAKILQVRKQWENRCRSEWEDVPFEAQEK